MSMLQMEKSTCNRVLDTGRCNGGLMIMEGWRMLLLSFSFLIFLVWTQSLDHRLVWPLVITFIITGGSAPTLFRKYTLGLVSYYGVICFQHCD